MATTIRYIRADVCPQLFSCQTDERIEAQHAIWRESSSHLNGTDPSVSEEENCFESISEVDEHAHVEVDQMSSSSVHENACATSVDSNASQKQRANKPWSEEERAYSRIDFEAKFSQYATFFSDRDVISPSPSDEMNCLVFNDEEDQQSNSPDDQADLVVIPASCSSANEESSSSDCDVTSPSPSDEMSMILSNEEHQQNEYADIVVIPSGSSSANVNESTSFVVPDTSQEVPPILANMLRSEQRGSLLSTHCEAKSSQNDPLSKHQQSYTESSKPSFVCRWCSRVFYEPWLLALHDVVCPTRVGKLPFECVTCGKSYDTAEQLSKHLDYRARKKYFCTVCANLFLSQRDLNKPIVIHTGKYPYHCGFCERRYTTCTALSFHVRTQHQQK